MSEERGRHPSSGSRRTDHHRSLLTTPPTGANIMLTTTTKLGPDPPTTDQNLFVESIGAIQSIQFGVRMGENGSVPFDLLQIKRFECQRPSRFVVFVLHFTRQQSRVQRASRQTSRSPLFDHGVVCPIGGGGTPGTTQRPQGGRSMTSKGMAASIDPGYHKRPIQPVRVCRSALGAHHQRTNGLGRMMTVVMIRPD